MANTRAHAPITAVARRAGVRLFEPADNDIPLSLSPTKETPNPFVFKSKAEEEKWQREREEGVNKIRAKREARRAHTTNGRGSVSMDGSNVSTATSATMGSSPLASSGPLGVCGEFGCELVPMTVPEEGYADED